MIQTNSGLLDDVENRRSALDNDMSRHALNVSVEKTKQMKHDNVISTPREIEDKSPKNWVLVRESLRGGGSQFHPRPYSQYSQSHHSTSDVVLPLALVLIVTHFLYIII